LIIDYLHDLKPEKLYEKQSAANPRFKTKYVTKDSHPLFPAGVKTVRVKINC